MKSSKKYNYADLPTLLCVLVLLAFGVLVVYTASSTWAAKKFEDSEHLLNEHVWKVLIAVGCIFLGMNVDYKKYQKYTKPAMFVAIGLLLALLILKNEVKGTYRFLDFGFLTFQPSEIAKFALVLHLSALIAAKEEAILKFKNGFATLLFWIVLIALLVMLQPNFSMGAMILLTGFIIMYLSGVRLKHLVLTIVPMIPLVISYLFLAKYRSNRIGLYIDNLEALIKVDIATIKAVINEAVIKSTGNALGQLWQGILAFGNGGLIGVGLGNSRQRDFFVPEAHGDFIFSIVGEEYGLIGTVLFMILFMVIFLRGYKIAKYTQDAFGKYLALSITVLITSYAFVNAGVTLGILPVTGLPMPFVSYGGTSIIISAYAIGVLLNISKQTDMHPKQTRIPVVGTVNAEGRV
ncbi:MAG: putative peptidoglycan glycosyltransferase FtsW [Bacteroidota bacterium]|nr:putative peptidoglycan glycosyltransferase FtsW [Bacteroidota bacterium]